jgi:hypothetical protein
VPAGAVDGLTLAEGERDADPIATEGETLADSDAEGDSDPEGEGL